MKTHAVSVAGVDSSSDISVFGSLTRPLSIGDDGAEERRTGIPACRGVADLGPLPRQRYPLVALLTLAEPEDSRHIVSPLISEDHHTSFKGSKPEGQGEEITRSCLFFQTASLYVIHVPDSKHSAAARILFQYLLTSQGNIYELKVNHHHPILLQFDLCWAQSEPSKSSCTFFLRFGS